jgi:hypothetical protein
MKSLFVNICNAFHGQPLPVLDKGGGIYVLRRVLPKATRAGNKKSWI